MSLRLHNFGGSMRSHLPAAMLGPGMHSEGDGYALHQPVLVLNASYEPINICAARRAIVLVLKGVAATEEINGHLCTPRGSPSASLRSSACWSIAASPTRRARSRARTSC